jgi:heme/copper-type cytochrome/quinol oxidase subunit 2
MISFFNTFLSYLILVIISMVVIVLAVYCGKKLREMKDAKDEAASGKDKEQ